MKLSLSMIFIIILTLYLVFSFVIQSSYSCKGNLKAEFNNIKWKDLIADSFDKITQFTENIKSKERIIVHLDNKNKMNKDIKELKDNLLNEKSIKVLKQLETLRKKIEDYLKIEEDKSRIPNFKENMEKSNTISFLKELLPTITDDDYFLDKRDSLVYSYLMEDEVN